MQRKRAWAVLATSLVLGTSIAGCIGTAAATALEHRSTAREDAERWSPDAELVNIYGWEGPYPARMEASSDTGTSTGPPSSRYAERPYADRAADDRQVDGRARFWVYRFRSDARDQVLELVYDDAGERIDRRVVDAEEQDVPVGTVNVDSDRALDKAAQDPEFRRIREAGDSRVAFALDRDDDQEHARWFVGVTDGDRFAGAVIGAVTGQVLHRFSSSGADHRDRPMP